MMFSRFCAGDKHTANRNIMDVSRGDFKYRGISMSIRQHVNLSSIVAFRSSNTLDIRRL